MVKLSLLILLILITSTIQANDGNNLKKSLPNIVLIIADDLGIGDLGCYGNLTIKTPNIDSLAAEGVTLRHHLAAAGLCTPSRAALLTARYPARYGLTGDPSTPPVIVHVASRVSLPESETTLAEALSAAGYSTAIVGKWHLGSGCGWFGRSCSGPLVHGFDSFFGMLFTLTEDTGCEHPFWIFDLDDGLHKGLLIAAIVTLATHVYFLRKKLYGLFSLLFVASLILPCAWFVRTHYRFHTRNWWQVSPWMNHQLNAVVMKDTSLLHQTVPLQTAFQDMLDESLKHIRSSSKDTRPLFLIHSFLHVHTPMFSSEEHRDKSAHGRYGDNVEEMDTGVGQILAALREEGMDNNTIVFFVSDHGGHLEAVDPKDGQRTGGYNQKFKGGKGMGAPEGAIRVPGIFRWTGVLPPGSFLDAPTSMLDILPTFLELSGLPPLQTLLPESKVLDGISFSSSLKNPSSAVPHERVLIHHCRSAIHGLRLMRGPKVYKMYLYLHRWKENSTQCGWGEPVTCGCFGDDVIDRTQDPVLFELTGDSYEDHPLDMESPEYREIVAELKSFLEDWKKNVPYPPSLYQSKMDTILTPWLQPLKIWNTTWF